MANHTPGPWKLDHETRGWEICTIHQVPPNEDGQQWVYVYPAEYHYGEPEENAANARLIAAAPDLLEALKDLRSVVTRDDPIAWFGSSCMRRVEEAIDKAEGR